ncbi:hypothetical protein DJ010_11940 [Nocardioides silvaticus]|uniref:Uncharacterized protein n=1 Tax=Nocardioides silvaticus TaxID=2201891 RepID=A0A316TDF0_9ACTN|nr:hypothetical protein [Nocardioides silvaticus]PWN02453.1 hypothetical protein DJ010_11940 [Nocardioides silvaticus]
MNWTLAHHLLYLVVCVPVIVAVGRTLARNGQVFLTDVFSDPAVATATNRLLVVGFYLLNAGFVLLYLRAGDGVGTAEALVESLSLKVGVVLLVLGLLHVVNVKAFSAIRRRHVVDTQRTRAYETQLEAWAAAQHRTGTAGRG